MSAEINQFVDPISGGIDVNAWQHDICGRLLTDHVGPQNAISTSELCMIYFGYVDWEKQILIRNQMQTARFMLEHRAEPVFLRSHHHLWYIPAPDDTGGARGFFENRAKRFVRAGRRLLRISNISQQTYQLPQTDPLVTAIEGSQPTLDRVDRAIELPSGEQNQEQRDSQNSS